jgi:hypothetical protein
MQPLLCNAASAVPILCAVRKREMCQENIRGRPSDATLRNLGLVAGVGFESKQFTETVKWRHWPTPKRKWTI